MTMSARKYKNEFTLDGRLKRGLGVSEAKVDAVKALFERHMSGDKIATATLHEALTTSDAIFNMAYLANLNFVPQYDEAPRNWTQLAGTRTVPDLKPVTLYSLSRSWTDGNGDSNVLSEHGAAPVIPEGTAYPYAYISGEVAQGAGIVKRGFKTDWTLEARINDGLGALERLPQEMLEVSLDTEQADVYGALTTQKTAASNLDGGLVPTGATVPANAPFSRDAVIRAIIELSEREIDGRKISVTGNFNLVVPVGQAIFVNFVLNQTLNAISTNPASGTAEFIYQVNNGYNPLAGVTVVESEWVTGTEWYLIPKPGTTRRPVLERLELRGYQTPQLFVENLAGSFLGGGTVSPFEGSFDADVITLKLRQFGGGVLWDGGVSIVYSEGDGN
jgi:hypothetical protein